MKSFFKKRKKDFNIKKIVVITIIFVVAIWIILSNTIFSREKIGTHKHRVEAPYCEADEECLLYNCTNCGNKYWVKKNEDIKCDKEKSLIIGCRCDEGKCKRVLKK